MSFKDLYIESQYLSQNKNKMKKQILSEEFRRMQKLAGIITEEEAKASPEKEDEVKAILKADYPTFVQKLGDNIKDPKFRAAIKSIADKAPIQTTDITPKVTDLKPTQNEIDVTKSLQFPLTDVTSAEVILKGGTISVAGKKIITGGGGKFIIDGHHRWSQVYVVNPEASITAIDISNIENPIDGLKATQLGIAGDTGKLPTVTVSGQNLLKMNETQLKKYVVKTITPEVAEVFKNILGMEKLNATSNITKEALNQMEFATLKPLIANYIWKNVQMMQQNNQPVPNAPKRDIMPQTDKAKQWTDNAVVPSDIAAESKKRWQKLAGIITEEETNVELSNDEIEKVKKAAFDTLNDPKFKKSMERLMSTIPDKELKKLQQDTLFITEEEKSISFSTVSNYFDKILKEQGLIEDKSSLNKDEITKKLENNPKMKKIKDASTDDQVYSDAWRALINTTLMSISSFGLSKHVVIPFIVGVIGLGINHLFLKDKNKISKDQIRYVKTKNSPDENSPEEKTNSEPPESQEDFNKRLYGF